MELREFRITRPLDRSCELERLSADFGEFSWSSMAASFREGRSTIVARVQGSAASMRALKTRYLDAPPSDVETAVLTVVGRNSAELFLARRAGSASQDIGTFLSTVLDSSMVLRTSQDARGVHWHVMSQDHHLLGGALERVRGELAKQGVADGYEFAVRSYPQIEEEKQRVEDLTPLELAVLRCAVHLGYYSQPKKTGISTIASRLNLSSTTAHRHLKKAEVKVLRQRLAVPA